MQPLAISLAQGSSSRLSTSSHHLGEGEVVGKLKAGKTSLNEFPEIVLFLRKM